MAEVSLRWIGCWRKLRAFVLRRDGCNVAVSAAGAFVQKLDGVMHVHRPRTAAGGLDVPSNCRILCVACHDSLHGRFGHIFRYTPRHDFRQGKREQITAGGTPLQATALTEARHGRYRLRPYALTSHVGLRGTILKGPISIFPLDLDAVEEYLIERRGNNGTNLGTFRSGRYRTGDGET